MNHKIYSESTRLAFKYSNWNTGCFKTLQLSDRCFVFVSFFHVYFFTRNTAWLSLKRFPFDLLQLVQIKVYIEWNLKFHQDIK